MSPRRPFLSLALPALPALLALLAMPSPALARGLSVEVWTDRGTDAVYRAGEPIRIEARTSDDAYLLVYEIDAQGYVHVLHPRPHTRGFVEGRRTVSIPEDGSDYELAADGPDGLGYVVAIASLDPFLDLPWYLRPYDPQAAELGYAGRDEDAEEADGVSAEGHIVGDPFVAMERIRRRLIQDPNDTDAFASSYTSYYVGHQVRYPRYLCADCHRPNHWTWWDGYDPYYTTCSVFDFRVNWGWTWGPSYWSGFVPYYVYTYRADCPPRWRRTLPRGAFLSSWDGWRRWNSLWSGSLTRYKSAPPVGYVPPSKWDDSRRYRGDRPNPPGFLGGGGTVVTRVPRGVPQGRGNEIGDRQPREGSVVPRTGPRERRLRGGSVAPEPIRTPVERTYRGDRPARGEVGKDAPQRIDRPRNERPRNEPPPKLDRPRNDPPPSGRPSRGGGNAEPRERRGRANAFVQPMRWLTPLYDPAPVSSAPSSAPPPSYQPVFNPPPNASAPPSAPPPAVSAPAPAPALPPGIQRLGASIASKRGG